MTRPRIKLENHKEIYEFYSSHRQGKRSAQFLHGVLGKTFAPIVHYAEGAEDRLVEFFEQGRPIVIASNHLKAVDPCIIAAMPIREKVFEPLLGNTFIPSKRSIQAIPVVRHIVDGLGAVPVFRQKDVKNDVEQKYLNGAARGILNTAIARMDSGQHMAVFPEGERNIDDPTKIQPLTKGIGLMVCKVSQVEQPAIMPMAMVYSGNGVRSQRTPTVFIGEPSLEVFEKPRDVLAWLPDRMQQSLDSAIQAHNE